MRKTDLVNVDAASLDEEAGLIEQRLRNLIELAMAIGKREGLLGKANDTGGDVARDDQRTNME